MKLRSQLLGGLAAACLLGPALPASAATVSDDDFKALKDMVGLLNQRLDQLEKARAQDQKALEQNQKVHDEDQQQIQRLTRQLQETQKTATDAAQKADAASQVQSVHPVPEGTAARQNFTVVGDAEVQFGKVDGQHSGFVLADFAPIFLFRSHDNVLFEAGFDTRLGDDVPPPSSTYFNLSFATLDYLINDYATFVGGYMLLPLGTYAERGAGWLNKIPDDPMAVGVVPSAAMGAQLRGALAVGSSGQSLTYAVYGANGPSSIDGSGTNASFNQGGVFGINGSGDITGNAHGSPAGGGRLGWFYPWKPKYDLELGVSGQTGMWDARERRRWSAGVVDAAVHLGPWAELKGECLHSWQETDDVGTIKPRGWWLQGAYKLAGLNLDLPLINNLELVGRYDNFRDGVGGRADRYTAGYVYYFTSSLLFEGDYEFSSSNLDAFNHNRLVFQVSYGF